MYKTYIIARREYNAMVRTKAFLISVILMPVLLGGAALVQGFLHGRIDIEKIP